MVEQLLCAFVIHRTAFESARRETLYNYVEDTCRELCIGDTVRMVGDAKWLPV